MANRNGLPEEPPRELGAGEREGMRHFVNHLRINLSLSEIRFDLAVLGSRAVDATPVWRFVTTPDHMQTMQRTLDHALTSYRTRFGEISGNLGEVPAVYFIDGEKDG
jgi:hypothetical protein